MSKLALRLLLAVAVLGDAGGLFKDLTAVSTLQRQDLIDTALSDIGVALSAQTGIHKHLVDITQTGRLAVDIVLTVAGTVIPAGDHHLVRVIGKGAVGIV